jgi:hypothetical protein
MFFLTFLKLIPSFFSSIFSKILEYPKTFIAILCLSAAALGYFHEEHIISGLKEENAKVLVQNDYLQKQSAQLKLDIAAAVEVNKANQVVLDKFEVVKVDSAQKSKDLVVLQQKNTVVLDSLRKIIQAAPVTDNGPVAKVLADTIKSIQNDRETQ